MARLPFVVDQRTVSTIRHPMRSAAPVPGHRQRREHDDDGRRPRQRAQHVEAGGVAEQRLGGAPLAPPKTRPRREPVGYGTDPNAGPAGRTSRRKGIAMSHRRVRIAVLFGLATMLWLAAAAPAVPSPRARSAKVATTVLKETAHGRAATFLVLLARQADVSGAQALPTKLAKGRFVFQTLRSFAARAQAPIKALLDRMGARYRSHWVVNLLRVTGSRAVVDALAARPDVAQILPDPWLKSTILP